MSLTRILLVACVALAAWAAWPKRPVVIDTHLPTRQLIISLTLARLDDAIVVLGDSIVEASTLPRSLCGHPIVNAGIGGASTESKLGAMLTQALGGKRAAMVVVALGTNDAAIPNSVARYGANYRALLAEVAALTPRVAILAIPRPEAGLGEAGKVNGTTIESYNAILPELAKEAGAGFIALPAMPEHHTIDGIHLNASGYAVWDKAILQGIDAAACKSA
jgi:GDSL-like lipase/acylhydrolase family protein